MEGLILIQDLAVVMTVAAVITIICHRFRLPVVLGYILAGVFIGPHTPPYALIKDLHNIHTLSELGVVFLLFSIGLEFSFSKLMKVGAVAFIGATLEIILMIGLGYTLGRAFGWGFIDSLFLGAILSISSTTIIAKVLMETKKISEKFAQVILGILIIEDLLAIIIIAILSGLAISGDLSLGAAGHALLKVTIFIATLTTVGFLFIPRLLRYLEKLALPETTIISVLGICFAGALLATKSGFSVALGAFLVGAIIAETPQCRKIVHQIEPIRDMFTAVFFVAVGMLIQPSILLEYAWPILIITLVTIFGKILSCSIATFLSGYNRQTSLMVGLGLAQIGEFSFIIANLGESTKVTSHFLYPIAVSVSAMTTLTTPFLMKHAVRITDFLEHLTPKPLTTVLGFYTSWMHGMSDTTSRSEKKLALWTTLRFYSLRLFYYLITGAVILYGAFHFQEQLAFVSSTTYWLSVLAIMLPIALGVIHTLDRIIWEVLFLNLSGLRKFTSRLDETRGLVRNLLRLSMLLAVTLIFSPIAAHFVSTPILFSVIIIVFFLFAYLFWGAAAKVHARVEKAVSGIFDAETPQDTEKEKQVHKELSELIREEYPWQVETLDFLVPLNESAINQKISDLKIRGITGATIVNIYRDGDPIPNPPAETKLLPGDVLLLLGDKEQVQTAAHYLEKKAREPMPAEIRREGSPKTHPFILPATCKHLGKTIRDLKLKRRSGATILGIQKGEQIMNNPGADIILEENDVLMLFGWPDEIETALRYLSV